MLVGVLLLFSFTLVGIQIGCKLCDYEITTLRKIGAAGCFVLLNNIPIPIPILSFLVPPVGLYISLMDDSYNRSAVNSVFAIAFLFAVLATLAVYVFRT